MKDGLVVRVGTGRSAKGNAAAIWQARAHVAPRPGEGAADLWQQLLERKPDWMTKSHLQRLLRDAGWANDGNAGAALRQVLKDIEGLR